MSYLRAALLLTTALGVVAVVVAGAARLRKQFGHPAGNTEAFLRRGRQPSSRQLVVCAGDSITHGMASANYVEMLRQRLGSVGYEFVNAGGNGNLAYNVLQRLDEIIRCQPDVVTLLVGTNDVMATFSPVATEQYRREQKLPQKPTLDWYRQNVDRILERLQGETGARIAVLDLPMLGEDMNSEMNRRVADYNAVLRAVAAKWGVPCLPLHERLGRLLPDGHQPPPYEGRRGPIASAVVKHYLWREDWNVISARNGLELLTDHVHLNDRAAAVVADVIAEHLATISPGLLNPQAGLATPASSPPGSHDRRENHPAQPAQPDDRRTAHEPLAKRD